MKKGSVQFFKESFSGHCSAIQGLLASAKPKVKTEVTKLIEPLNTLLPFFVLQET